MKIKRAKPLFLLIAIVIVVFFYFVLNEPALMDSQEIRYPSVLLEGYDKTGYYRIIPETILESLELGDRDVFTALVATPDMPMYSTSFSWRQADYLNIANALQEFVWKEEPNNWNIHSMSFYGDCMYDPVGFDIVNITYYKETGLQKYDARMVGIYPLTQMVAWGASENYPRSILEKWKYIDPRKLMVTADNTLELAEKNGGSAARLAVDNACRISVLLSSSDQTWDVIYTGKNSSSVFEIKIDPFTGKHEDLKSRP